MRCAQCSLMSSDTGRGQVLHLGELDTGISLAAITKARHACFTQVMFCAKTTDSPGSKRKAAPNMFETRWSAIKIELMTVAIKILCENLVILGLAHPSMLVRCPSNMHQAVQCPGRGAKMHVVLALVCCRGNGTSVRSEIEIDLLPGLYVRSPAHDSPLLCGSPG
jgi:hypothetical protein